MSSKQQRAVKGKEHKVSRNEGWNVLSWDDLTEWAGSRSVERGRAYQRQGRVHDLAISEDGWLLATVTGGARYAVKVWCEPSAKKGGALYSRCTCPVGASGCKHAVAVVAEYLERLGGGEETPMANQDDERWELLADETGDADEDDVDDLELDMDSEDDEVDEEFYVHRHRHQAVSEKKTRNVTDEKIWKHIEAKNREELVALVWSLTERFPELREEFSDRIALGEGNVDRLVTETRKELRLVASEAGWRNSWTGEGQTPDYSRVKHRLERLLELGHPDAVVRLGTEIMTLGNEQIGQSNDEGETAEAVGECLPVIFEAVVASTLTPARKLLFAIDAHLRDDYGIVNDAADAVLKLTGEESAWSEVADVMAQRAKSPVKEDDPFSRKYQHERIADWLIRALENAGRERRDPYCLRTGSARLRQLRTAGQALDRDEAIRRSPALGGRGNRKNSRKAARHRVEPGKATGRDGGSAQAMANRRGSRGFGILHSSQPRELSELLNAAAKAGCEDSIRGIALNFLETGVSPLSSPGKASVKGAANAEWPLPMPDYLLPLLNNGSNFGRPASPHFDVLIDMAIADHRHDDVLRWYDAMSAGQQYRGSMTWYGSGGYGDRVAAAVTESHPERSLAIYRQRVDDHLPHASASAYEAVAGYLRKMRPIFQGLHRNSEWDGLLADIRLRYKNRPKFMEILDKLDPRPIVEQTRVRR